MGGFRAAHVFYKAIDNNVAIYSTFVLLALLTSKESLELSNTATQATVSINMYCSEEPLWTDALANQQFVLSAQQLYENRDSGLNGICSSGLISFINETQSSVELVGAQEECQFTALLANCSHPMLELLVSAKLQAARRSGVDLETLVCSGGRSITNVVCREYNAAQATCIASAGNRLRNSRILGCVGLVLYPIVFWRSAYNFISFLVPMTWGFIMMFVQVEQLCIFYSIQNLAYYVTAYSGLGVFFQGLLFLICLGKGIRVTDLEKYIRIKQGGVADKDPEVQEIIDLE